MMDIPNSPDIHRAFNLARRAMPADPGAPRNQGARTRREEPKATGSAEDRGREADRPPEIPRKGWGDILWRTKQQLSEDNLTIVVFLLWLFLSAFIMLFGAELNAEMERQTRKDTTGGEPVPLGERGAYAADTVGPGGPAGKQSGKRRSPQRQDIRS